MTIAEFIRDKLLTPRIKSHSCLVVYDREAQYRELCLGMQSEKLKIIDVGAAGLEGRLNALALLRQVGRPQSGIDGLIVYVQTAKPLNDEEKQKDPFAIYAACGTVFPDDDGDEFLSICLRAKPDHATAIRKVFAETPAPTFAVIDAIGGGLGWPHLRALLDAQSVRDILYALMAPSTAQEKALKGTDNWVQEARDLLKVTLGFDLKSKIKAWATISEELWRFCLFSEFAFDLPVALPSSLGNVPKATPEARPLIEDLCDRLRSDLRSRNAYVEHAEAIEKELNLREACGGLDDLGERDTFPFEERTFLKRAIEALKADDVDRVREIVAKHASSVWLDKAESQSQWGLIDAALRLVAQCDDFDRQLPDYAKTQASLIDFYIASLREVDRLHREFEQAASDFIDPHGLMSSVVGQARTSYRKLAEKVQAVFMRHLETTGWPPANRLANADVFDRFVAKPLQQAGHRVAYILVDALRYELGVALEHLLAEDGPVTLDAAFAQLPTITTIGMGSLLPEAGKQLTLRSDGTGLVPTLGDQPVGNVTQRMEAIRKRYGARFTEMRLGDYVMAKDSVADTIELFVLRSVEIDSQLENDPQETLGLLPKTLSRIRAAIHRLRKEGFKEVIIATDHGFYLNAAAEAGDVCSKPTGDWAFNAHDRMLLGQGGGDSSNLVMAYERLGVRGDFPMVAMPKSMAPYSRGLLYFHGGASLQEAVVPVLSMRLEGAEPAIRKIKIDLTYRNGAKRITTRTPVVEVMWANDDMFEQDREVEILLQSHKPKGDVVGEPRPGGVVDPATRTISLRPNVRVPVALKMLEDFEGKFTIKALNPNTLVAFNSLALETDYTV